MKIQQCYESILASFVYVNVVFSIKLAANRTLRNRGKSLKYRQIEISIMQKSDVIII